MEPARFEEPLCSVPARIEFAMHGYAKNVYLVRNLVDQAAKNWALPRDVRDDARLVLCEFATNACRLYPRQMLKVWVAMPAPRVVEVAVWDPDPFAAPRIQAPSDEDENGRGLNLVLELSTAWGWYPSETTQGKVVWARLVW